MKIVQRPLDFSFQLVVDRLSEAFENSPSTHADGVIEHYQLPGCAHVDYFVLNYQTQQRLLHVCIAYLRGSVPAGEAGAANPGAVVRHVAVRLRRVIQPQKRPPNARPSRPDVQTSYYHRSFGAGADFSVASTFDEQLAVSLRNFFEYGQPDAMPGFSEWEYGSPDLKMVSHVMAVLQTAEVTPAQPTSTSRTDP